MLTNLVSGAVFALIPAVVGGALAAVLLQKYWWVAIVWQLVSLMQFAVFFGIAVFSAMCAGKKLGMVAVFAMINFFSMLLLWIAQLIYEPLLPGVEISSDWFEVFCPLISILRDQYLNIVVAYGNEVQKVFFHGYLWKDWYYLFACVGVGAVFTVLAWLIYRKRHLETAGDFISFRPLRILFLLAYTLAAGALTYDFMGLFWGREVGYGFFAVGIVIGWFTGWMLLERSVKIFTKKAILSFIAFVVLLVGSISLTLMDPMGIAAYVPPVEKIDSASIYLQQDIFSYSRQEQDWGGWFVSEEEELAQVRQLHSQMQQCSVDHDSETITVYVRYQMKNGMYMNRAYNISAESQVAESMKFFFSDVRSAFAVGDWSLVRDHVTSAQIYSYTYEDYKELYLEDREQMQQLLDAILADSQAGNLAQHDHFHPDQEQVAGIEIAWDMEFIRKENGSISNHRSRHISIYEDCVNTVAFLEKLQ